MKKTMLFFALFIKLSTYAYDYDLVIIGSGASGLIAAQTASAHNKRIALIDKDMDKKSRMWHGDIPLKTLIKIAEVADTISKAQQFGLSSECIDIHPDNVFSYIENVVEKTSNLHSISTLQERGIHTIFGNASFIDQHTICVENTYITSEKFIIATGGIPFIPDLKGINDVPYLLIDSLFQLKKLPKSIIIAGQGPIGAEIATALHRLGVKVTLLVKHGLILPNHDFELVEMQYRLMKKEGLQVKCNMRIKNLSYKDNRVHALCINNLGQELTVQADTFLIALGKVGDTQSLGLEKIGVKQHRDGIIVDRAMKTNIDNVYACGEVIGQMYTLSRVSYYQAKIAGYNVTRSFWQPAMKANYNNASSLVAATLPLGATGITEQEARKHYGQQLRIYRFNYTSLARAYIDSTTDGIAKFICDQEGNLLGAHVLGASAGEIIDSVQIGKPFADQFKNYLPELRTSPSYLDMVWEAAKKCKSEIEEKWTWSTFIKRMFQAITKKTIISN